MTDGREKGGGGGLACTASFVCGSYSYHTNRNITLQRRILCLGGGASLGGGGVGGGGATPAITFPRARRTWKSVLMKGVAL